MSKVETQNSVRDVTSRAERLIETEIWCNDSMLISALLEVDFGEEFQFETIQNWFDVSSEAMEEFLIGEGQMPKDWDLLDLEEQQLLADENGFTPEVNEIYEWWRISEYLARQLLLIGEPVLSNNFGTWWGRCCTGQAISMDGTIQRILIEREAS